MDDQLDEAFDIHDFFLDSTSIDTELGLSKHGSGIESDDPTNPMEAMNFLECHLNDYIPLGAIRMHRSKPPPGYWLEGAHGERQMWPSPVLTTLTEKGALKTQLVEHGKDRSLASLRIFALAEDVSRHVRRGSIQDFRRSLKHILPFVDLSPSTWDASYNSLTPVKTYIEPALDQESLFYIFNTLKSPTAHDNFSDAEDLSGLSTELYPYQRRSVATMLRREINPTKSVDPRKPLYRDQLGRPFYFDVQDGILLRNPHLYEECRGGVLAETMGYGKTLICLAVILATRGHFPSIPEARLAVRSRPRPRVASLLEMAAASAVHHGVPWKAEFHALAKEGYHYDKCTQELRKYVREYIEPIFHPSNPNRQGKREHEKTVQLCYTTLVVVPPNLLVQWQDEIKRHVGEDALDVLTIDHSTKIIPDHTEVVKYDVVLITKARLEQEYRDDDLNNGKIRRGEDAIQSPLTKVRWLRIICDEGHGFAGSATKTNALAMIDKMYIERRWVVSGTPSSSMLGVEVGLAAGSGEDFHTPVLGNAKEENLNRHSNFRHALLSRRSSVASDSEFKDMEKLRLLAVNFLKIRPWSNAKGVDYANWKKYFAPFDINGKRRKAASLRTLLQSLIVRHRIEDIDADLCLPPLHNRSVLLEPSYYDKISMNLFILVLTSNAITAERTDEDYMFHPKNRKRLETLISNLRQSAFHWVGFRHVDITEALRVSKSYLTEHIDLVSDDDGLLLTEAIMAGRRALADMGWRAFSVLHEIGVYLDDFPDHASAAWSIHGQSTRPLLLGTVQARSARKHVLEHMMENDPTASLTGAGVRAMQSARTRAAEESQARAKAADQSSGKAFEEPKLKNTTPSSSKPGSLSSESPKRKRNDSDCLRSDLKLKGTEIVGFTSAKLTYLVDQIITYQNSEKIIIFYDANNVAFWVAEALELLGVKFLIYANTLTTARRATYLATFNHNDDFRVLLMDLKQAAHGLHVACASRVYIINPIWQPNIESQAIKRAHRIGQKRVVHVETLVLRGTLEEKMLNRRKEMSNTELQKAKSLLDDLTMAEIIKNERFIKFTPREGIAMVDPKSGNTEWTTSEDAKVAKLSTPLSLFGREMVDDTPEAGLILASGDVTKIVPSVPRLVSASKFVSEAQIQKKPRMTV